MNLLEEKDKAAVFEYKNNQAKLEFIDIGKFIIMKDNQQVWSKYQVINYFSLILFRSCGESC